MSLSDTIGGSVAKLMAARKGGRREARAQAAAMSKSKRVRVRRGAAPNPSAPLGQGGRFAALKQKLASRPDVRNPGALAASIGRRKYGASRMAGWAAAGRS